MRSLCTSTQSSLCSWQLEKACTCNKDPAQQKINNFFLSRNCKKKKIPELKRENTTSSVGTLLPFISPLGSITLPWWLSSKESAAMQETGGNTGLISGSGRSPGGGHGNPLQILAWEVPWTEQPGGLQSTGSQRVRHD